MSSVHNVATNRNFAGFFVFVYRILVPSSYISLDNFLDFSKGSTMGEVVASRDDRLPRKLSSVVIGDKVISGLAAGERVFGSRERGFYSIRLKNGVSFRATADLPKHARAMGHRTVEVTLGHWPEMSVAKARVAAKLHIATVKGGADPRRMRMD
jgi:hypothetical protein